MRAANDRRSSNISRAPKHLQDPDQQLLRLPGFRPGTFSPISMPPRGRVTQIGRELFAEK